MAASRSERSSATKCRDRRPLGGVILHVMRDIVIPSRPLRGAGGARSDLAVAQGLAER
jgi:hypothetical protein